MQIAHEVTERASYKSFGEKHWFSHPHPQPQHNEPTESSFHDIHFIFQKFFILLFFFSQRL